MATTNPASELDGIVKQRKVQHRASLPREEMPRILELMDAKLDTPEGDELDTLRTLVEDYEAEHFPIGKPNPVETNQFRMEQLHSRSGE